MQKDNYLYLNTSILYRCAQKFYDRKLVSYEVNAAQVLFLILIYEEEGINMQQLAQRGCFDKGTITKGIAKLEEQGYVISTPSPNDKRVRLLYTSDKTKNIIRDIYLLRQQWWEYVSSELSSEEISQFENTLAKLSNKAKSYELEESQPAIKLFGIQKLTLLDYPQKMASTIFTGGCNFRCPFCQNADLVFLPENMAEIKAEDILTFLKKRKGILDGVCISGGEPLLNAHLEDFLMDIKALGYAIKLDTNGSQPQRLRELVEKQLIDYVAMDVKNSKARYGETTGIWDLDLTPIEESIAYLKTNVIPYEFRTTIVSEFHTLKDIEEMSEWLSQANAWYLQKFEDSEHVIQPGLHACSKEEMQAMLEIAVTKVCNTHLRGI